MQTEQSKRQGSQQGAGTQPISGQGGRTPVNTGISSGNPIDKVGGAGMGKPPGEGDTPAASHPPEKRAVDVQDHNDGNT
jgi:hypothetical protein